jgi:hypothetical protein
MRVKVIVEFVHSSQDLQQGSLLRIFVNSQRFNQYEQYWLLSNSSHKPVHHANIVIGFNHLAIICSIRP